MEHSKHLWRAILILVFVFVVGIIVRHFAIPKSFGLDGPYRYEALNDLKSRTPVHGSRTGCQSCHSDVWDTAAKGKHATINCEVCHAPLTVHAQDAVKTADMPSNRSADLCAYCHQKLRARPEDMPQLDFMEHLTKLEAAPEDGKIPEGTCIVCHDAHSPSLQ